MLKSLSKLAITLSVLVSSISSTTCGDEIIALSLSDADYSLVAQTHANGPSTTYRRVDGVTTPQANISFSQQAVRMAKDFFTAVGIDLGPTLVVPPNVSTDPAVLFAATGKWPILINVAANGPDGTLLGRATTATGRPDRFNRNRTGQDSVIAFVNGRSLQEVAVTIAHEIGHTLGLVHHNGPDRSIMGATASGVEDRFALSVYEMDSQALLNRTHNPGYHLLTHSGFALNDNASPVLQPGSWDVDDIGSQVLLSFEDIFDGNDLNQVLTDVDIHSSIGGSHGGDEWSHLKRLSIGNIADVSFDFLDGERVFISGNSNSNSNHSDIILETPDGNAEIRISKEMSSIPVVLRRYFDGGGMPPKLGPGL